MNKRKAVEVAHSTLNKICKRKNKPKIIFGKTLGTAYGCCCKSDWEMTLYLDNIPNLIQVALTVAHEWDHLKRRESTWRKTVLAINFDPEYDYWNDPFEKKARLAETMLLKKRYEKQT